MTKRSGILTATVLVALLLAACGGGDDDSASGSDNRRNSQTTTTTTTAPATTAAPTTTTGAPPATAATVAVASSNLGQILVDSAGLTVYMFDNDQGTTTACNAGCQATWPPVTANGTPTAGAGVDASKLSVGPNNQVVYNGHLLYRYAPDTAPGDTKGDGVGGIWHALTPAGTPV